MYCSNCRKEIPNQTNFCPFCGAPQIKSGDTSAKEVNIPSLLQNCNKASSHSEKEKNNKIGCGCLVILIFVVMLGALSEPADKTDSIASSDEQNEQLHAASTPTTVNSQQKKSEPPVKTTQSTKIEKTAKTPVVTKKESKPTSPATQQLPKKAIILDGAVQPIPTQKGKGFDKTIARYGVNRIKRINTLLPKVAEKAATAPYMDIIWNVDISDNMSTQNELIFYADAKNGNRVYINENLQIIDARKMY